MTQAVIVQGCKTSHGGVVIQGNSSFNISGIGAAGKGYMVACPKCKGIFPISEGAPNITLPDGAQLALAGMKTACGATLLASSFLVVADPSSPFGSQLGGNPNDDEDTTPPPEDHKGRFQLVDNDTGEPIANRRVRVTMGDGTSTIYASDEQGFTDWVHTQSEEEIHLNLVDELDNE